MDGELSEIINSLRLDTKAVDYWLSGLWDKRPRARLKIPGPSPACRPGGRTAEESRTMTETSYFEKKWWREYQKCMIILINIDVSTLKICATVQ